MTHSFFPNRLEKHNGFDTEKGRNGSHGMNGNGTRALPPDGMYHTHTPDIAQGLESGMTDKVDLSHPLARVALLLDTGTDASRCMNEQTNRNRELL